MQVNIDFPFLYFFRLSTKDQIYLRKRINSKYSLAYIARIKNTRRTRRLLNESRLK